MSLERATRPTVPAGEAVILRPRGAPWSLAVTPGDGGSAAVAVSLSDPADADVIWHDLDETPLTERRLYLFPGPVAAVRVSATDAVARVELMV